MAPTSSGTSALVKILIGVVLVFVVFGAFAAVAMIYIGHRVHRKAQELGLTRSSEEMRERATLRCGTLMLARCSRRWTLAKQWGWRSCGLRPKGAKRRDVTSSVSGDPADMTAKHVTALHKKEMNKSEQDTVENFGRTIFHGAAAAPGSPSEHPGEAPVFSYSIDNNAAQLQMRLNKAALGDMGPAITPSIPNLGDEAFDAAGAMLFVRKGDKVVRIMYMTCPCGLEDVLPLARKIVDGL